ncbi:uncharacterized Golgi apparatus membrane protein-like protein CG5021 isoform X2 [Atheta coriaria]|uniref:uncharacterized Golgi apparatus membrane protein-like protein CG5021 isoform X2 n=1 Tax=Dalotia coriaria TaxID=877792 RepID=UPI0031F34C6C
MASVPLLEDDTLDFGEEDHIDAAKKGSFTHPYVTFIYLAFRGGSIATYLLCGFFSNSFIASFVFIVLLLSMDFWTVKNVTGRLMVGLRWWNYVDDNGQSHWVFESRKGQSQNRVNDKEATIFWLALVATPVIWGILFVAALFSFSLKWLLLVIIALTLTGANLYGYLKCKFGSSESITSVTSDFLKKQVMQNAVSMMASQASPPTANPMNSTNTV